VDRGILLPSSLIIQVIERTFLSSGITVSKHFSNTLYTHFSAANTYSLFPDVLPSLARLSSANVKMGIISDMDNRLYSILDGLGIKSHFKFVILSYIEGYSKPSRALYEAALQNVGHVDEVWHVGDDPTKDAFENVNTVIIDRHGEIETEFTKIRSFEELPKILDVL
jgi:HAD superfamily hydrolase (TIGR01549 family)